MQHFLIVHDDPADGMDIEHAFDCPLRAIYDGMATEYGCQVERLVADFGIDHFFSRVDATPLDPHLPALAPGRYEIQYWLERIDLAPHVGVHPEWNEGLSLVEGGAA